MGFESGEIPKKSSARENRIRMCSFCRKRHILGYSYCPAYGRRCSNCGCLNHIKRACWHLYPEFSRFRKGKVIKKYSGTRRSLNDEWKETQYTSEVENAPQSDIDVKVIDELPQ